MARVHLSIDDSAAGLTLATMLQAAGHEIDAGDPEVLITDDYGEAVRRARQVPTFVLATVSQIPEAIRTMQEGVQGYVFVPLQPGEASVMIHRALSGGSGEAGYEPKSLDEVELDHIEAMLRHCNGNRAKAARLLGIGRNTLWRKLKRRQDS